MKTGLQEINELVGIWGSLIINNQGEIILNVSPPGLTVTLGNITNHVVDLLISAEKFLPGVTEVVFHYAGRKLFVLDLEKVILVVICTSSVDISLLRMTANVVVTSWQTDPKIQKQLKRKFVERL